MFSPIKGRIKIRFSDQGRGESCEEFLEERRIDFGNSSIGNQTGEAK
jgi:hypothetical protein